MYKEEIIRPISVKLYKNDVKNMVDKQKEIVLLKKLSSIKNEDLHIFPLS